MASDRPTQLLLGAGLWLLLAASLVLSVTFGPADIAPTEVWQTIGHHLGFGFTAS